MAFKFLSDSPNMQKVRLTAVAATSYTRGYLLYRDTSTGEVKEATTTTGDATNVEAIVAKTETTGSTTPQIEAYWLSPGHLVVADCTNNTAANQLNKAHLLTNGGVVNNTSTHSTDVNAIFVALGIVGASTDNKLWGYVVKLGQVTA